MRLKDFKAKVVIDHSVTRRVWMLPKANWTEEAVCNLPDIGRWRLNEADYEFPGQIQNEYFFIDSGYPREHLGPGVLEGTVASSLKKESKEATNPQQLGSAAPGAIVPFQGNSSQPTVTSSTAMVPYIPTQVPESQPRRLQAQNSNASDGPPAEKSPVVVIGESMMAACKAGKWAAKDRRVPGHKPF